MGRGRQELRVAANRASIGALDQKLSRPEVGVSGGRIDSEPPLKSGKIVILWFGPSRAKLSAKVFADVDLFRMLYRVGIWGRRRVEGFRIGWD
ncbi:hypothetical protein PIB30_039821 [Stylosanthes scabra]|uniref:Uncharacterized protein n=1 Tax=Stylosanthes scabra TaxID=79078 RepID=A0ABU6REH6_9FABA|nr:hypothetical protein [Stylosanthes scabra]